MTALEKVNKVSSTDTDKVTKQVKSYIKCGLTITALILTYFVANKFGILLQTMNLELLQRIINIILGMVVTVVSTKK